MDTRERDYYEILGISRNADQKAIKDAYHRLAMKWHPDRNKSPEAETRFKEIAKAYAILSDPAKRAQYDAGGFESVAHYSTDDLFRNIDLGSLFDDLDFGFGSGGDSIFERFFGSRSKSRERGEDLHINVEVPLEKIAFGGSHELHLTHPAACPHCNGQGTADGKPPPPCPECGGRGRKVVENGGRGTPGHTIHLQQMVLCSMCGGRGVAVTTRCSHCNGSGRYEKPSTLKLQIPAGADEGMTLRIPDRGAPASTPGMKPGHLFVSIYSLPDSRFERHGADLRRTEQLQLDEAVLGCSRIVPTLGREIDVKIPPGAQPGELLRIRGKGLPVYHSELHGDMLIRLQVEIPRQLSGEERELFERLRELRGKKR
jgi:molecular chaperone DnaJ